MQQFILKYKKYDKKNCYVQNRTGNKCWKSERQFEGLADRCRGARKRDRKQKTREICL